MLLYRPAGACLGGKPHGLQDCKFYSSLSPMVPKYTDTPVNSSLGKPRHAHLTQLVTQKCLTLQSIFLPLEEGLYQFPKNLLPSKRMEKLHSSVPQAELCPLPTPKRLLESRFHGEDKLRGCKQAQVGAQWLVSSDNKRVNNHPRWASSRACPDSSRAEASLSESSAPYLGAREDCWWWWW